MEHRSWGHQQPGSGNPHGDPSQSQGAPRAGPNYGPGTPQHNPQHSPPSGANGLPPPGGPFPPFHQPAHSLASLAGLSQSSPRQPPPQQHRPEEPDSRPPPGFGLPSLSQATGQSNVLADRERREREMERIHIKEEEDRRHREHERQRMEQAPPHQTPQGPPVHLHQPVAVGPRTVHGPNGLLGNPGMGGPPPQPHLPLGAPSGPGNIFAGGPVQPAPGPAGQHPQAAGLLSGYVQGAPGQPPQQQQQQQAMGQPQGQGQGQQPILNDALSYLDQVKVQFHEQPDVYNRFLDIMKDFKSGAIDTPGVIGRVSTLFAGNPELIQGFNTFLPPGYRIECGTGDDPNAIRVTTPMGTTVQSMPQPRPLSRQEGGQEGLRPANGTFTPQPGAQSAQMMFSPSGRPAGPAAPIQQHLSPMEAARQQEEQRAIHQQEQRGVNSLQSAVSAAAGGTGLRVGISPRATPMPGQDAAAHDAAAQVGLEKRGPVEFNHAISYVNKIKNRFASHPDIYKQFLEILQTYQRESKPIQDVYSQVTHLFKTAPDLLEDFKQFLPESAAHAKQAAERARQEAENNVVTSNVRSEGLYNSPVMSREITTPAHARGQMPPIGNFAPTPASKDNKRKREQRQGTADRMADGVAGPSGSKAQFPGHPNKRLKTGQQVAKGLNDQPPASPTLTPRLPEPLEPTTTSAATSEELSFFDKAKKAIGNKNSMNEFLKLCNLFSQDLIDRGTLLYRARAFIGGNAELMKWFEQWLGHDEKDVIIENKPRVPSGRVMLSNCRGLGPSYRLLPKRERQKPCSGRDELCNSVLNDEWASHPTWASEDSGFIAHRKNLHEEGLHRIEEERHDYDYNIEACSRTIQLLEPIATQLRRMDEAQQRNYQLPPGLGGQSETIYKRVIMKLYGRDKGADVIDSLHARPYQVIPVLLNRLKERLETWKMAQREWEKVWREQTQKMFWKSLDHQAANAKTNDRRQFQTKTLQAEIQVKHEEMKRAANINPSFRRLPQMEFTVDDVDVLTDATYLVLAYVDAHMATDQPRLFNFIRDFVALFFRLDDIGFRAAIDRRFQQSPQNESIEDPPSGGEDSASVKSRKGGAAKNSTLLRAALDRGRTLNRTRDDSNASESRGSTPDIASNGDHVENTVEDETMTDAAEDSENKSDIATGRWLDHPTDKNVLGSKNINPQELRDRDVFHFWANTPIYCFMRLFLMLYERLTKLKSAEDGVREAVQNAQKVKPAIELGIVDKLPSDYFNDTSSTANYYNQMLSKFEELLRNEVEQTEIEETLRRYYLQAGYQLYPVEKIVMTLTRDALQTMNSDGKDKSADVFALFKKDRVKEKTSAQQQTDYRKAVEKMVKDSEVYRIDFDPTNSKVRVYLSKRDDPIADDGMTESQREELWRYYIASYTSVDNTDGIEVGKVSYPFLMGNVRVFGADPRSESFPPAPGRFIEVMNEEKLEVRIAVNNYRAFFQPETFESFHSKDDEDESTDWPSQRDDVVKDITMNNNAMVDMSKEDVESKNSNFLSVVNNE
ncbi:hypothetical protein M409DRAFT_68133 [Zasmidium cellare ATCC 36951]|uniref:Histone deacetylase interacting domain-containing protein n=1 Tax=Zasmidium cellare ATCC 36951 TaxID=1080233 RepID=A0A6A6CA02_ZASCE|nr:uncharacterized protein M409DRAFT_68133 [Zasmidium cellare ATCC 36951]KAF2163855.1 hypothetical protein M409DRAFT_68133 [Zasmidium cellare ATCC 36951]